MTPEVTGYSLDRRARLRPKSWIDKLITRFVTAILHDKGDANLLGNPGERFLAVRFFTREWVMELSVHLQPYPAQG